MSLFNVVSAEMKIRLPMCFAGDVYGGLHTELNKRLLKSDAALGGVVLAYQNLQPKQSLGRMHQDLPFLLFDVSVDFVVFSAGEGCVVEGVVNKIGTDYIGLLVFNTFNASISQHNMAGYVFDAASHSWKPKKKGSTAEESIQAGDLVRFKSLGVNMTDALILISGTLKEEGMGIVAKSVVKIEDEEEEVAQYAASETHHKKHSHSNDEEQEEAEAAAQTEAPAPAVEEKKKKKAKNTEAAAPAAAATEHPAAAAKPSKSKKNKKTEEEPAAAPAAPLFGENDTNKSKSKRKTPEAEQTEQQPKESAPTAAAGAAEHKKKKSRKQE